MSEQIKILLVDDHPMIRHGIKALLEDVPEFEIIGEGNDGTDALEMYHPDKVDLVIMDIKMPNMDGIEATTHIIEKYKDARVLALSMYDEQRFIVKMLQAGAMGYVLKNTGKKELEKAIRTILGGESYFSQEVSSIMMSQFMGNTSVKKYDPVKSNVALTKREAEIIRMIAEEFTNTQIAEKLGISPRTVDTHRRNLLQKLDVKNTAGLVKFAIQNDLLD